MKKRFLFPLIYLGLEMLAILLPLEGLLFILFAPVNLLILAFEIASGAEQGTFTGKIYLHILGGIFQCFLIGYAWDKVSTYFRDKKYWDKPI